MLYNFDEIVDRSNTYSSKWDSNVQKELFGRDDLLPYWVADMEFKTAPEIIEVLKKRVEHGIFGYSNRTDEYYDSIINWTRRRFNYSIDKQWILFSPGVVPAVNYVIQAFSNEGEGVIINEPVYYPFKRSIEANNRVVVNSPLILKDNMYHIDFNDLEIKLKDPSNKILILCSPHNPVSRVWTEEELIRLGDLCIENNVLVLADEIHNDLILRGNKHTMFASLGKKYEDISITATAPSKTFNLAGLYSSNIIVPNEVIRKRLEEILLRNSIGGQGPLSIEGVIAAYDHGEKWLDELLLYLNENVDFIEVFLEKNLPRAKLIDIQGTYLAWIDLREYEEDGVTLEKVIIDKAGCALDGGTWFGESGSGFLRFNFAAPREFIKVGLERIANAINEEFK